MRVELRALYDGTEHGLAEHRLSLGAFGAALTLLLAALRRTASSILGSAIEEPEYVPHGRLHKQAALIDLEFIRIDPGCAIPCFGVVLRDDALTRQARLPIEDLHVQAAERLVRDIEAEAKGILRNAAARRYLAALPSSVTRQKYTLTRGDGVVFETEFGTPSLPPMPEETGGLFHVRGHVTATGFQPGVPFVQLKVEDKPRRCAASERLVDRALDLRGQEVVGAILSVQNKDQLLSIAPATTSTEVPVEITLRHLDDRWSSTLRRLAQ